MARAKKEQTPVETLPYPQPRANGLLFGHAQAERQLLAAWESGRMHHAWLICGPAGVGKATLAYRFARFLLNGGAETESGANLFGEAPAPSLALPPENPVFQKCAQATHPDLLTIAPGYDDKKERARTEIVVEEARKIGSFLSLTPAAGSYRVVVVDAADNLNRNAANAILKILEEAPKQSVLLLVSHAPGRLLPTIRSRCRVLRLAPLPQADFTQAIGTLDPGIPEDAIPKLYPLAGGCPGTALSFWRRNCFGVLARLSALLAALPRPDTQELLKLAAALKADKNGESWQFTLRLLAWLWGRGVRRAATGERGDELVAGENALADRLAHLGRLDRAAEAWENLEQLALDTERLHFDKQLAMLTAFGALEGATR